MPTRGLGQLSRGAATLEAALLLPLLLMAAMALLQFGLYLHAENVAAAAVQDGARVAAGEGRTVAEGERHARALLSAGLGQSASGVSVTGTGDRDSVTLTASGAYPLIIPWVEGSAMPLRASATLTRERFRPLEEAR